MPEAINRSVVAAFFDMAPLYGGDFGEFFLSLRVSKFQLMFRAVLGAAAGGAAAAGGGGGCCDLADLMRCGMPWLSLRSGPGVRAGGRAPGGEPRQDELSSTRLSAPTLRSTRARAGKPGELARARLDSTWHEVRAAMPMSPTWRWLAKGAAVMLCL